MNNLNRDNQEILRISKNIAAHTSFMNKKSDDLKRKVMLLVEKLNNKKTQQ
jgi:hypothetical protein